MLKSNSAGISCRVVQFDRFHPFVCGQTVLNPKDGSLVFVSDKDALLKADDEELNNQSFCFSEFLSQDLVFICRSDPMDPCRL